MRDLAVLIPTRGRPDNIRKVISAWDFTNAWDRADMVLVIDKDDPEYAGYLALVEETRHPDTEEPLIKTYEVPTWVPMVHKLNQAATALAPGWFALGFAGDDHLPRSINWARRYLTVLHELGTGMVYGDDGYQGKNLSTEWAVTADAVRTLGRMVPAEVEHMYCDNAMMDLFGGAGAMRYLPEIRIEHMHPYAGKADSDEQYKRVNDREQFRRDRAEYAKWQRNQMAVDINAIIALRPKQEFSPGRRRSLAPTQRKVKQAMGLVPKIFKNVRGATPDEIGVTLADFAGQVASDEAIVEIGVFQGRTALLMGWGARQGQRAHIWAIDAWELDGNTYGEPFRTESSRNWARYNVRAAGYSNDITLIQGFSLEQAANWAGPKVGLLFIDADHSYEGARQDVLSWSKRLADGAIIAVDDYGHPDWPGVAQAVDELVDQGVLDPIEIFHDRLAVTRLAVAEPDESAGERSHGGEPTAITSEGVSPSPYPAVDDQVAVPSTLLQGSASVPAGHAATVPVGPAETMTFSGSSDPNLEEMTLGGLRALAKRRGIVLGKRKDLKADIIQALVDGK
jgi:predicted O-methyltransferase YrrM